MRQDICDLLPILFQSGFYTEGFPNLEQYLYRTVGLLPHELLLRLALDSSFLGIPEISAKETKVYRMLKCHLSIINHSSITQFDDITLSNHNFDRVSGADLHSVSGPESRPDLSLQTDLNKTYYSVYSQAQRQVYRVTERSLGRLRRDRANSCRDIVRQVNREFDNLSNSNWQYTTTHERFYPIPNYLKAKQFVQIYKPKHDSSMASAEILLHTAQDDANKGKLSQPKSNQHQLAPINPHRTHMVQVTWNTQGDSKDKAVDVTEAHVAMVKEVTHETGLITKIEEPAVVSLKEILNITEVGVKIIRSEGDEDSGMAMIPLTMTEITGIETLKAQIILTGADDGMVIEVKDTVTGERKKMEP